MVAAVLIPRFGLRAACSGGNLEPESPIALAPVQGSRGLGEVSTAAERAGVEAGMTPAEALARCPQLRLVAADPHRAAELWEQVILGLEKIGAAVESKRPGEAFFATAGLRGLHGGTEEGVLAAARTAVALPVCIAAAPARLAAVLAAMRSTRLPQPAPGREAIVPAAALAGFLGPQSVAVLRGRLGVPEPEQEQLIGALQKLGLSTLGRLRQLRADQLADRFGRLGLTAWRLARGEEEPLRPRTPPEPLVAAIELPEGCAGPQLDRALELLVGRLLADPRRHERTLISLRLSAVLLGGGSWSVEQGLGRPSASAATILGPLDRRLADLPGPAGSLHLRATALGRPEAEQLEMETEARSPRQSRLAEAVREVRAAAGPEALHRLVDGDQDSRLPERRFALLPYEPR